MKRRCTFILNHVGIIGIVLHQALEMKETVFIHGFKKNTGFVRAYPHKFSLYNDVQLWAEYKLYLACFSFFESAIGCAFHAPQAQVPCFYRDFLSVDNNSHIKHC